MKEIDVDEHFKNEMGLLGKTLQNAAQKKQKHLDWLSDFKTIEEFEEAYQQELEEIFPGQPDIVK